MLAMKMNNMINKEEAKAIAHAHINKYNSSWTDKPEMVITGIDQHSLGWLLSWTSSRYLETNNINDALTGNGPILVSELTGDFEEVGTAPPIEDRVEEASVRLRERIKQAYKEESLKEQPKLDEGETVYRLWDSSAIPVSFGSSDDISKPFPIGWIFLWGLILVLFSLCLWLVF